MQKIIQNLAFDTSVAIYARFFAYFGYFPHFSRIIMGVIMCKVVNFYSFFVILCIDFYVNIV